MPRLLDRDIERVLVIDDEPMAREGNEWLLEDGDFQPVPIDGPLNPDPSAFAKEAAHNGTNVQAALCDQRLGIRSGYAAYLGSELVSKWYAYRFPAVLCTKYEDAAMNDIRPLRRWIPALLTPDELHEDPDVFVRACQECIYEFDVGFRPHREPWRAQVYVAEVDEERRHFWVELPAWEQKVRVRLRIRDLPRDLCESLRSDSRLFAKVNLGAERIEDLYFWEWEEPA